MAETTGAVRMAQVVDSLILDLQTSEEVGWLGDVLVDDQHQQVVGFTYYTGVMRRERHRLSWRLVASVGRDGIIVDTRDIPPEAATALESAAPMAGLEIWSDAGERVGQLADFEFDPESGQIQQYLFSPQGWRQLESGLYGLAPDAVISAGRKRMMVKAAALATPERVLEEPAATEAASQKSWPMPELPEELQMRSQRLGHQAERLREKFQGHWPQSVDANPEQLRERSQQLADQAKGQFGQVMKRFRQRSRRLRHQLRETVADWSEDFPVGPDSQPPRRTIDIDSAEAGAAENQPPDDRSHQS